ncbi:TetR/AcrR family transcriptional regulator [Anaerocolumna sp. AGMB13025]|uniref:TetR/AcrR family transcriptional regulator n=1 Tax=Anaerocolumna sp. AGMB13025 TaxID=3039116 RepID=UPI00241EC12D|nr:TetR/AcrR family transcriptional regulator [Anaerocolumna sp. AGMB13025]WFR57050.1 TetR/AcrR family transcriptional regulator [Anaerocolumna sp. AGMB13025]
MSQITKIALAKSLKKFLTHNTLDKITVKDIVEDCGVNRQTFYYHFQDIYDLVEWIFITEGMKALDGKNTSDSWQEGFLQVFYYVQENKPLVVNTFHSIGRDHLERFLYNEVYKMLIDVVNEQAEGLNVSEESKTFIADFYKYAFVGIMMEWIRTGMKEDPKEITNHVSKLITGDIRKALLKYQG